MRWLVADTLYCLRVLFEDWNVLDAGRGLDISAGAVYGSGNSRIA